MKKNSGNNIYTLGGLIIIPALGNDTFTVSLPLDGYSYKIKSVFFDYSAVIGTTYINESTRSTFKFELRYPVAEIKPAHSFIYDYSLKPSWTNGEFTRLKNPNQIFFDNFFCSNKVEFVLDWNSFEAVNSVKVTFTLAVEVELIQSLT